MLVVLPLQKRFFCLTAITTSHLPGHADV